MWKILVPVYILSACHGITAVLSICLGIASSLTADVWMAHRVSPIWSGGFIMVFAAFSAVSMVVGVVNIQLLKMGLVNHMLDGDTLRKEKYDDMVIIAIATAGAEILVCIISGLLSIRVAHKARKELYKKNEGTFSITVHGEKDIIIHPTKMQPRKQREFGQKSQESGVSTDRLSRAWL
ncbi:hypothetical protein EB796_018427 [Bugula neritina]|uniref:Uncharacterized protein n=1 Tax=Bugula neritina TaxID=10212 RepID=A0A7J7JAK2_BUGNE|nr:hypothetical protein EB796_018427 [Bugula neritina]